MRPTREGAGRGDCAPGPSPTHQRSFPLAPSYTVTVTRAPSVVQPLRAPANLPPWGRDAHCLRRTAHCPLTSDSEEPAISGCIRRDQRGACSEETDQGSFLKAACRP